MKWKLARPSYIAEKRQEASQAFPRSQIPAFPVSLFLYGNYHMPSNDPNVLHALTQLGLIKPG